ncbi:MAG: hypothetical protein OXG23_09095 [Chloroflexi bacterium]|nr:hypothetical protein [Chloroflexota bacterium]
MAVGDGAGDGGMSVSVGACVTILTGGELGVGAEGIAVSVALGCGKAEAIASTSAVGDGKALGALILQPALINMKETHSRYGKRSIMN